MKKSILSLAICLALGNNFCFAQFYQQNFDGADTNPNNSLIIHLDTSHQNIWQIGAPHKHYFDSAYSRPNVIVTDTSIPYPIKNTSIFSFEIPLEHIRPASYTIQWVQKLDMDSGKDGGIVEFSIDTGRTWNNAFNNPYTYNFMGFQPANEMVLPSGDTAFSGTDSTWEDIWLCFDFFSLNHTPDSLYIRYRFVSDSINNNREGWMIDNMAEHFEVAHPVKEVNNDPYLKVYPRLTYGPIYIKGKANGTGFEIQQATLINELGQVVQQTKIGPGDSYIDISSQANGWYVLQVKTSVITKSYSIFLSKP